MKTTLHKLFLSFVLLVQIPIAFAVTFTVNYNLDDLSDPVPDDGVCETVLGNGQCTLRAAIESANETPNGPHFVNVPYLINQSYPVWSTNSIQTSQQMTIRGTGNGQPIIEGGLFIESGLITVGERATLENLEFRPNTSSIAGSIGVLITSPNMVTLNDITVIPGPDGFNPGVSVSQGRATCNRCIIRDGESVGLVVSNDGIMKFDNSRISNNHNQARFGGGIFLRQGSLIVQNSLIDNNQAIGEAPNFGGSGGGIFMNQFDTQLQVINSTISNNKAYADGGGIFAQNNIRLENVTITQNYADFDNGNAAGSGGGIYIGEFVSVTAKNSIIHGNFLPCPSGLLCFPNGRNCDDAAPDINIGIESLGWVMTGNDESCPIVDLTGETNYTSSTVPNLGLLTQLGGLFPVHPVSSTGSEADGGDPDGCTYEVNFNGITVDVPLDFDQRGMTRPLDSDPNVFDGNSCDIGAYEAVCFGVDPDDDYVGSECDVCPNVFDPLQEDSNDDGIGDACSADIIFYNGFE